MSLEVNRIGEVAQSLGKRPEVLPGASQAGAAVAAILTAEVDPALLFIQRVRHDRDPWSGHIALPGGRIEESDSDSKAAAERETREEVGLDLGRAQDLGQLDDITGHTIPLCVACHVYGIDLVPTLDLNHEVDDAFEMRLSALANRAQWLEAEFEIKGERKSYPAIDLGLDGKPLLWGLTYRFVIQILDHAGLCSDD